MWKRNGSVGRGMTCARTLSWKAGSFEERHTVQLEENKQGGWRRGGTRSMRWEAVKSQCALSVTVLIKKFGLHSERKGKPLRGHSRISQWQERQEGLQRHRSSKLSSKLNQVSEEKSTGGFQFRPNVQLSYRSLIFIPHRPDIVFYSTEQKWRLCSLTRRETAYLWTAGLRKKD